MNGVKGNTAASGIRNWRGTTGENASQYLSQALQYLIKDLASDLIEACTKEGMKLWVTSRRS